MLVDADLWLCALDLAAVRGWKPRGTEPPSGAGENDHDRFAYFVPSGQRVVHEDALELASRLREALSDVSDTELPLQGRRFGDENTLDLLTRAAGGILFVPDLSKLDRAEQRNLEFVLARAEKHKTRVVSFSPVDVRTLGEKHEFDAELAARLDALLTDMGR